MARWLVGRRAAAWAVGGLVCLLMSCAEAADALPTVLRYGVLAGLPPLQSWPDGGEPGGADVLLVRELAQALNLEVQPVRYEDLGRLEADLRAGRLDLASGLTRTPARSRELVFTVPYGTVRRAMVTRRDAPSAILSPDLAGRVLAVVMGSPGEDDADRFFPLATRALMDTAADSLREVAVRRADVAFEALPVVKALMRDRPALAGLQVSRTLELPSGVLQLALPAVRRELAQQLSMRIDALSPQAYERLLHRAGDDVAGPPGAASAPFALAPAERAQLARLPPPTIAVVGGERPIVFDSPDGVPSGLSIDMLKAVLQRLGLRPAAWRRMSIDALPQALRRGEVDWVIGLEEGGPGDELLRFVGPYLEQPIMIIGRRNAMLLDLEQLRGRTVALPPGHEARGWIDARHPTIRLLPCGALADCVAAVEDGRADATLADVVSAGLLLAERPRAAVQMMGTVPELRTQLSLGVAARHAALLPAVQRALDDAMVNELPDLKQRWLVPPSPERVLREVAVRWLPWMVLLLCSLLALWWWHSGRLRREVRRREHAQLLAERASQTSARFVTFLAHEVRNSLHSVIAGTELIRSARDNLPSVAAGLRESARSTLTLLNNLLDRDRLEAGRLSLQQESAHLDPVLRSVALEMGPAAQARQLTLRYRPGPWDPLLRIDAMRVQQVVRNLVANAIKYSERGEIGIESHCEPLGGEPPLCQVEITVRDQGPGVAPEDQAHLFEPFFIADEGRASGAGTGLGLALCRDLARLMGGELRLDSRRGVGTAITLRWQAEVQLELPSDEAAAPAEPKRVLVVEDAEVYAMLLEHALVAQGCQVSVAGSVADAEAMLPQDRYDLVLTDLHLADGGALRVIEAARRLCLREPVLVVMSAELADADMQALREAGAALVLTKASDATLFVRQLLRHPALRAAPQDAVA